MTWFGHQVGELVEPPQRELGEDPALVGDLGGQHPVVGGHAVAGDHHEVARLVPVQVAHLAGVQMHQARHLDGLGLFDESGHGVLPVGVSKRLRFSRTRADRRRAPGVRAAVRACRAVAALSRVCRCGRGGWRWPAGPGCRRGRAGPAPGTRRRCRRRRPGRRRGPGRARSPGGGRRPRCPGTGSGRAGSGSWCSGSAVRGK